MSSKKKSLIIKGKPTTNRKESIVKMKIRALASPKTSNIGIIR
jgi:hypothetical protein